METLRIEAPIEAAKVSGLVLELHHLEDLRRSGLSDDTIRQADFRTESDPRKLAAMLNRQYAKARGTGLVIPFRDIDGNVNGFRRVKPTIPRNDRNGRAIKYESPSGAENHLYFPPGIAERIKDSSFEILITEGEKKALKAVQDGFVCIGLTGVFGWKRGKGTDRLIRDLEVVPWKSRAVVIVYDSDLKDNETVLNGETRLAKQLESRGAHVKVARLPNGPNGEKVGIDDYLISNGAAALRKLLDAAEDPEPLDEAPEKDPLCSFDPMTVAREYIEQYHVREDRVTLIAWRGEFYRWNRVSYKPVPDDELRADLINYCDTFASGISGGQISNILECVKAETILPARMEPPSWFNPKDWDASRCLATKSGILPVDTLAECPVLIPSTPDLFVLNGVDYEFDPAATCPAWEDFLNDLWPDDPQSIEALREAFGCLLLPDTSFQKMFMLLGPKRSGKGTIARILKELIGPENVCSPRLAEFGGTFGMEPLLGKSVAIIGDARLGGRVDSAAIVEVLLSITGEDSQTVHRKHRSAVNGKLPIRFVLLSNEIPRLSDASATLPSRMVLLRLTNSFFGREDRGLTERLLSEKPGILNWALRGWQSLNNRGYFVQPSSGADMIEDMEDLSSPMAAFLKDRCVLEPGTQTAVKDLFAAWKTWCELKGRKPGNEQVFGRDVRAAAPSLKVTQPRDLLNGGRYRAYDGVKLDSGTQWNGHGTHN